MPVLYVGLIAAFGWLDVTLATVSVFEESTAGSDHGRVRCSLYMAAPQDEERGPWKAVGTKPGGDDLITPGQPGSFDWGLCYSTPPMQAEHLPNSTRNFAARSSF